MRNQLLALPPSLLALISASHFAIADRPWLYSLQQHEKYSPEHETYTKRDMEIQERMAWQPPVGVQKMGRDPGEKFYMHYWLFEETAQEPWEEGNTLRKRAIQANNFDEQYANASLSENLLPPLLLHSDIQHPHLSLLRFFQRDILKRGYQCPSGTNNCSSIDRPNSCCASGETCVLIEDTGLGDVGCCPDGDTCAGSVSSCDTSAGYTSCPDSDNGGCCIPGYTCDDVGCIASSTLTTTTTLAATTRATNAGSNSVTSTAIVSVQADTTTTTTVTPSTTTTSTTARSPTATISSSSSSNSPSTEASSSASAVAPVRPTGNTDSSTITSSPSTTYSISGCPTGFYMCSAFYQGGCCRVDRDCHSTSCPARISNTVINSDGVTIVAPSGATAGAESGSCATGWFSCAASQGGGCCPSGYACGSSCTRTATGIASASASIVGKVSLSSAGSLSVDMWGWMMATGAIVTGAGMILL